MATCVINVILLPFRSSHRSIAELSETEKTIGEEVENATRRIEEINAELETVICQLGEAKVERHESSRAVKKQELIENLKRLFPGVVSWLRSFEKMSPLGFLQYASNIFVLPFSMAV